MGELNSLYFSSLYIYINVDYRIIFGSEPTVITEDSGGSELALSLQVTLLRVIYWQAPGRWLAVGRYIPAVAQARRPRFADPGSVPPVCQISR
jgi:hypothetical protein